MAMITTVSEEEWGTPLDPNTKRTKDNTIFSFIKRGLSQTFAQSIVNRLTPEALTEQINERPLGTREALAKELSVYDSEINADNVGVKAADILVMIITKSAGLMSEEKIAVEKEALESYKLNEDKTNKDSSGLVCYSEIIKSDELLARHFLINHEAEKELIPLCQIALLHSPEHKHVRSMYTEFILLPKEVQRLILKSCDADSMTNIDSLHFGKAMDFFCKDLEKYELSSRRYLYMFDQYLYRAFNNYSEYNIRVYDDYSFMRLLEPGVGALRNMEYSSIDAYIEDYLWLKENESEVEAIPPMDYLWIAKDFGTCKEEELTYWLCRFVIDACNNLFHRVKKCDFSYVDVYDQYAETQEDLYYCVVNALYNHYLCHTQNDLD